MELSDEWFSNNVVREVRDIRKSFGGVHALKGVSLSLE